MQFYIYLLKYLKEHKFLYKKNYYKHTIFARKDTSFLKSTSIKNSLYEKDLSQSRKLVERQSFLSIYKTYMII